MKRMNHNGDAGRPGGWALGEFKGDAKLGIVIQGSVAVYRVRVGEAAADLR